MNNRSKLQYDSGQQKTKMQFAQATTIDLNKVKRQNDGSIVLNAGAFKVGDYDHWGFEVPLDGVQYNDPLIGRLELSEAQKILDKFEGLTLTQEHKWISTLQDRQNLGVGTVISNAALEGDLAMTRIVITDPMAITKIETGEFNELSIGFEYTLVDVRKKVDGVDFLIKDVDLNHLALVTKGRAGKEARLYNHARHEELIMAKVTVDGKEYDVPNEVATHIAAQAAVNKGGDKIDKAQYEELQTKHTTLKAEFDALNQNKEKDDSKAEAIKLAKAHAEFAADLKKLGVDFDKGIGDYDPNVVMKEVLTKAGYSISVEDDNPIYVKAMFNVVKSQHDKTETSAVATFSLPKTEVMAASFEAQSDVQGSNAASKAYFFGKGEKS